MFEALREGGPRKRDGGGGRLGLTFEAWSGEELGERARGDDDMVKTVDGDFSEEKH